MMRKRGGMKDDAKYFGLSKWKDAIDIYRVHEDLRWHKFGGEAR